MVVRSKSGVVAKKTYQHRDRRLLPNLPLTTSLAANSRSLLKQFVLVSRKTQLAPSERKDIKVHVSNTILPHVGSDSVSFMHITVPNGFQMACTSLAHMILVCLVRWHEGAMHCAWAANSLTRHVLTTHIAYQRSLMEISF